MPVSLSEVEDLPGIKKAKYEKITLIISSLSYFSNGI